MSGTLRLRGATSGYSELQAPAVAADQTFVLPTAGGTLLTTDSPAPRLTLELGSVSQPSLTFESDTDTGLYSSGANTLNLVTGGTERVRIDSAGRVGIGTSSPTELLHLQGDTPGITLRDTSAYAAGTGPNIYFQGKDSNENTKNFASIKGLSESADNGKLTFETRTGGSMFERMRIESDGKVKAQGGHLYVQTSNSGTGNTDGLALICDGNTDAYLWNYENTTLRFGTNATERMRINASGRVNIFANDGNVCFVRSSTGAGTTDYAFGVAHSATFIGDGTISFAVFTNGNAVNTNNSYGAISDAKLKENIVDANSQWDDIKALQIRNYNFIEGQTHTQIGLIAQEAETVSPGLVSEFPDRDEEGNDLGTVTKSVNYSVLYMKSVKALQEAMERIETLEANNLSLENRIAALENN